MFSVIAMSVIIGMLSAGVASFLLLPDRAAQPGRHAAASRPVGLDGLPPSRRNLSTPIATNAATYVMPPARAAGHPSLLSAKNLEQALGWLALDRAMREQQRRDFTQYLADVQTRWALRPQTSGRPGQVRAA